MKCNRPQPGWYCSRPFAHEGPCAARPTRWKRLKQRLKDFYYDFLASLD